jgi:hypothetical protein
MRCWRNPIPNGFILLLYFLGALAGTPSTAIRTDSTAIQTSFVAYPVVQGEKALKPTLSIDLLQLRISLSHAFIHDRFIPALSPAKRMTGFFMTIIKAGFVPIFLFQGVLRN